MVAHVIGERTVALAKPAFELKPAAVERIEEMMRRSDAEFVKRVDEADMTIPGLVREWDVAGLAEAFALVADGDEAGYIVAKRTDDPRTVAIGPMWIRPEFRGGGAGSAQVELFTEWAREQGYQRIWSRTWGANARARRIFEGLGFRRIEEIPAHRVNGDPTLTYEREL
jgi:RimJ/RimL family protein N-acetyltransferase